MITSMDIWNFQSHKKSHLEFSPGVNVIVGQSDAGKTAIIRALKWVFQNRPGGNSIKSWWGGETEVKVNLSDAIITKTRAQSATYYLNDTKFKAMGTDVPEEIQRAINFSEINIQQQLDRPYLLDLSAGEVAGHFNRVAHLDVIDKGVSNVQHWIRGLEGDIKAANQQLEDARQSLKELDYLSEMEVEIAAVERLEIEVTAEKKRAGGLKTHIKQIENVKEQISQVEEIFPLEKLVNQALEALSVKKEARTQQMKLQKLVIDYATTMSVLAKIKKSIQAESVVNKALQLFEKRKEVQTQQMKLANLVQGITTANKQLATTLQEVTTLSSQMPDICPFCGAAIK